MSQPATAGIIVGCIFAGIAVLYFSYRGYVKWHRRKTVPTDAELPPVRELQPSYIAGGGGAGTLGGTASSRPWPTSSSSMGTLYETSPYASNKMHASGSRPSLGGGSIFRQSLGPDAFNGVNGSHSRRDSSAGIVPPTADSSVPGSPIASPMSEMGVLTAPPTAADSDYGHHRMSSASSTMALKRTYAGSVYKGSVGNTGFASSPTFEKQQRRDSWLPHSPLNRDWIHIVPPQPLGAGFGSLAMATDERTLGFSKNSGIGSGEEVFSSGLVWAAPGSNQTGPAPAGTTSWSSLSQDQRHRYLQDGPSRGLASTSTSNPSSASLGGPSPSASASASASTSAIQPNRSASGSRNDSAGEQQQVRSGAAPSRTASTAGTASAEGVEATLGEMPSSSPQQHREALSHLKAVSSSSDAYANPAAFTSQTSPLQALSQHGMNRSTTPQEQQQQQQPSPRYLGTPERDATPDTTLKTQPSPILGPAFHANDSSQPVTPPVSTLSSANDSPSSRIPDGSTPSDFAGTRRVMLGQDGKLQVAN